MVSGIQKDGQARNGTAAVTGRAAALLTGVAEAARRLLAIADFDTAVNGALEAIATSAAIDRIFIYQHHSATNAASEFATCPYEWTAPGIPVSREMPGRFPMVYGEIEWFSQWLQALKAGEPVQKLKKEMSAAGQALQDIDQALSVLTVPIFIEGEYWGNFGFDDCATERVWSEAEIAALETAAACFGSAIERDRTKARMADVEAHNQALAERDRILEATAAAANVMLVNDDFESAVNQALQIVGEGLNVDRVNLGKHYAASQGETSYHHLLYEWNTTNTVKQAKHPELSKISNDGMEFVVEAMMKGDVFGGIVNELPEPFRRSQIALGVQSTYAIPVHVAGQYWGLLGLDDCHRKTRRSESELEAIKTLANCIGSAIEREQIRKAREAAERTAIIERERAARADELEAANKVLTTRDRWLETTAAAANQLLSATDITTSVKAALATIGENLACDRLAVMRHVQDPNGHPLGAVQSLYEWDAEGVRAQIDDPELQLISAAGLEDWFTRFHAGEWVGGHVADLPEPARSGQAALGVLSTYAVPILIDDQLWGLVGMDYCREARKLSAAELAVFQTAASCVGSAIYQAQVRRDRTERAVLEEREKAAQERVAELAKVNHVLKTTIDTLVTEPELSRFLGYVLQAIALQFGSPFLEYWRNGKDDVAYLELVVINGDILTGEELVGHHGVQGLAVPPDAIDADTLFQRTQYNEYTISPTDRFTGSFYDNISYWCRNRGVDLPDKALNFPVVLSEKSFGAIAIFLPNDQALSEEIIELGYALTNQAALALQLTQLAEEAKQAAILQEREKAARDRATELAKANEAIAQTLNTLTETPELETFLGQILTTVSETVNACKVHLFLYDEATDTLNQHITVQDGRIYPGAAPDDPEIFRHPFPSDITGGWQAIVESEKPFSLDARYPENADLYLPETVTWHQEQGHASATCACMKVGNKPIGFIGFAFRHLPVLTDEQLEFIQALTNQATLSIHLTRLAEEAKQAAILQEQEKAAQERVAELAKTNEAISYTLTALTEAPELDDFLSQNLTKMAEYVGACKASLFLYDDNAHTLTQYITVQDTQVYRGYAPTDPELFQHPVSADISDAWETISKSEKPFVLDANHPEAEQSYWPETMPWHKEQGHLSSACACMRVGTKAIGFIGFAFRSVAVLTDEQLEFIQALTNQATLSIYLTRLAEQSKTAALSVALTEERNRLAREIHDTLAQAFTGVSLQLEAAKDYFEDSSLEDIFYHVGRAGSLARQGLSEARRSVRALRSQALTTDTLPDALRTALTEMTQDSNTTPHIHIIGTPRTLPEDIQTNLLRIGQEATTNTLRHAEADTLTLTLTYELTHIHMHIRDDGKGFTVSLEDVEGFGLVGMRERVLRFDGKFSLTSKPGQGTVIDIAIPVSS